jgi:hypothetical protein
VDGKALAHVAPPHFSSATAFLRSNLTAVLDGNAVSLEIPAAISLAPGVVGCRGRLPLLQKNGKDKDSGFQVLLLAYGLLTGPDIA